MKTKRPSPVKRLIQRIQWKSYAFFHRSRETPYFLYEEQKPPRKKRGLSPRIATFLISLGLLTFLALSFPLRPTYSDQERRDLTSFPTFSLSAVADGSYFSGISTWFADTFPLRDLFLSLQNQVESLYGVQTQKITGNVTQGDKIPVVETEPEDIKEPNAQQSAASDETPESVPQPEQGGDVQDTPDSSEQPSDESGAGAQDTPDETQPEQLPAQEPEEEDLTIPELDDDAVVEKLSAVLSIDNAAYEYYNFVQEYADNYTDAINRAAEQLEGISNVYSIIVPNSMGICVPTDVQNAANTSDQKAAIEYMNACLSEKVTAIPVYHTLLKHYLDGEYLYFRTDHHWTALGAYRAYEQFAQAAGFTPTPLEDYISHEFDGFLGTFYNSTKSEAMAKTPDTVYAYEAPSTNNIHITNEDTKDWLYVVIGNVENSSAGNKYGTFIGGDNPFSYVENPNKDDGSAIMLVKESYGNAFAPFLIENYQYVYIVDYRYVSKVDNRKIAQMCQDLGVDDVLFLNTISTTRADSLIQRLADFVG
ncbi:MAG: DHHW family protein [Candidatus Onthomonas sp.]